MRMRRSIYQFLIAVRQQDGQMLMNESGDVTRCVTYRLRTAMDRILRYGETANAADTSPESPDGVLLPDDTDGRPWDQALLHL